MIKWLAVLLCFAGHAYGQDINIMLKEADNAEKQLKEAEALDKYRQILVIDPVQVKALVKCAELNVTLGNRQTDKAGKKLYYETALSFAGRAWQADSSQADAAYVMAMTSGKMTDVETENKKIVAYVKDIKRYADKALSINPNHAKANYVMGKWNYEMATLAGLKKAAVKVFYGGLPEGTLENAIRYMEKSRSIEPYFAPDYLDLAKAYKEDHKPAQALEVLNRLVKLPTRTSDDAAAKAEGAKMLESMQ